MIIQQFSGIIAVIFYSTSTFISAGIPVRWAGLCTIGLSIVNIVGVLGAFVLIEKKGRLFLFFWSISTMAVMCVLTTIFLAFSANQIIAYLAVVSVAVYLFMFMLGTGPIPWMMTGEYMPSQYSAGTAAIVASTNWFCNFLVGLVFPPLQAAIGQYVFVIFAGIAFAGAIYVKFRGVESKGKSVEQIQEEFKTR